MYGFFNGSGGLFIALSFLLPTEVTLVQPSQLLLPKVGYRQAPFSDLLPRGVKTRGGLFEMRRKGVKPQKRGKNGRRRTLFSSTLEWYYTFIKYKREYYGE